MTVDRPSFELPASVAAYLSDPSVRTGVNALLKVDRGSLPEGLELDELGQYVAARAAAELTWFEWTATLHGLWSLAWAGLEGGGWRPASLDDLQEAANVDPKTCWQEKQFTVYHTRDDLTLYTAIGTARRGVEIAFSIESETEYLVEGNQGEFAWCDDSRWSGWLVATTAAPLGAPAFDPGDLVRLAGAALATAEEAARAHSSRPRRAGRTVRRS